jgi:hypothetical protein
MTGSPRNTLRERLLAQQSLPSERLEGYRREVDTMLKEKEKAVARERKIARWMWFYIVALSTAFMVFGGLKNTTTLGVWFTVAACFWLLLGSVFLLKQLMNQHALETLKELRGLEVRLLERMRSLEERGDRRVS